MSARTKHLTNARPDNLQAAGEVSGYDCLSQSICGIAESLRALNEQAVLQYTPVVESILDARGREPRHIERTLDGLLDFCGYDPALVLFKRLCRHYWEIDPVATAGYINAYRDFFDSENCENNGSAAITPEGGRS